MLGKFAMNALGKAEKNSSAAVVFPVFERDVVAMIKPSDEAQATC
jgi:hypothetical protein